MEDVITVIRKEFWELRHSGKNLYWLLVVLVAPIIFPRMDASRSLVPVTIIFALLPSLVALGSSGHIVFVSILGEKKAKTLEILLSTNMSTLAIVVGKIIPAIGVGYILSQISFLGFLIFPTLDQPLVNSSTAWLLFGFPLLVSYAAACLSMITTVLVPDEKTAPMVAVLITFAPLVLLGRASNLTFSPASIGLIIAITVLLCGVVTWLASLALERIPLITKL